MTPAAMTLALAHPHAAPAFNGLFYATAATIIPVLFLALVVQGALFDDLVKMPHKTTRAAAERLSARHAIARALPRSCAPPSPSRFSPTERSASSWPSSRFTRRPIPRPGAPSYSRE